LPLHESISHGCFLGIGAVRMEWWSWAGEGAVCNSSTNRRKDETADYRTTHDYRDGSYWKCHKTRV